MDSEWLAPSVSRAIPLCRVPLCHVLDWQNKGQARLVSLSSSVPSLARVHLTGKIPFSSDTLPARDEGCTASGFQPLQFRNVSEKGAGTSDKRVCSVHRSTHDLFPRASRSFFFHVIWPEYIAYRPLPLCPYWSDCVLQTHFSPCFLLRRATPDETRGQVGSLGAFHFYFVRAFQSNLNKHRVQGSCLLNIMHFIFSILSATSFMGTFSFLFLIFTGFSLSFSPPDSLPMYSSPSTVCPPHYWWSSLSFALSVQMCSLQGGYAATWNY